jgi:hypothetical protein
MVLAETKPQSRHRKVENLAEDAKEAGIGGREMGGGRRGTISLPDTAWYCITLAKVGCITVIPKRGIGGRGWGWEPYPSLILIGTV